MMEVQAIQENLYLISVLQKSDPNSQATKIIIPIGL